MTTTTPNLGLTLWDSTSDLTVPFATFRANLTGPATSNMTLIDTFYGNLSNLVNNTKGAFYLSATGTNTYSATSTYITSYFAGLAILLTVPNTNTSSATLEINALGSKNLMKVNSSGVATVLLAGELVINRKNLFVYDGTQWIWVGAMTADQITVQSGSTGDVVTLAVDKSLTSTTPSNLISTAINSSTAKTTPANLDKFSFWDSVSGLLNHITWSNIRTTLDTIYTNATNLTSGTLDMARIASGAITNTKLANMAELTFKGRVTAGTGVPEDITDTQLRNALNVSDGANRSDSLTTLINSEVSIVGATTLTSTAFGKMHVCTGTTVDYTIVLPPTSGNLGKIIGFRMSNSLTKLVILDGNASETIDGSLTRIMWKNEVAILYCDGVNWTKLYGKTIPMIVAQRASVSQTGIVSATLTKATLGTTISDNVGNASDTTNSLVYARRTSFYSISVHGGYGALVTAGGTNVQIRLCLNGSTTGILSDAGNGTLGEQAPRRISESSYSLNAGDFLELYYFQNTGANQSTLFSTSYSSRINLTEIPTW